MKKWNLILCFVLAVTFATAQDAVLQSSDKGLYLMHTVAPRENFYALGRLYNIPAKDIAAYNKLDMNNGLNIGQHLMIPLTAANFTQAAATGAPVYYVVGEGEGLFRVSSKNGGVLMANLRKWNNLPNDNLTTGQRLIVGYIKGSGPLQQNAPAVTTATKKEESKTEAAAPQPQVAKSPEPAAQQTPKVVTETPPASKAQVPGSAAGGGYFKDQFDVQSRSANKSKEQTSSAGIFKTASGWQDGKYYALMDGVEPGTILKVVNPTNNKVVYAKVLGGMSGIRQNQGLDVRISNAAASMLNINETDKFIVKVNY